MNFQMTLKAARVNAGFRLIDAAKLIGIGKDTLIKWERNSGLVNPIMQQKISSVYKVPIEYIFFGKSLEFNSSKIKRRNNMNELKIFNNPEFGQLRTLVKDNETWFVGKDVAEILGYSNTQKAIRDHVDTEDKLTERFVLSGQNREAVVINESGLYSPCAFFKTSECEEV